MATLSLTLLGDAACELDGEALRFTRRSALALAIYLACAGRSHSRAALAALIAGERDEARAAIALRNALHDLRAALGDQVRIDTRAVALAPALAVESDVAALEAAAQLGDLAPLESLRAAADGYRGEFARGLLLADAPAFDEWLRREREQARARYVRVLEQLAGAEERAGQPQRAIAATRRLLAEEPWREEAHRRLMRLLAADGQRAAALLQFAQCREILQRELGVAPQPETLRLYEQLQGGPVGPPHNLPARTTPFVDRPAERALLRQQLRQPGCRLITLCGLGGTGKTRLALELAAALARVAPPDELAFPDGVFLVVCEQASPSDPLAPSRLAYALLRSLNLPVPPGASPDAALLRWLAPRRVLLVLDNAEDDPHVADFARAVLAAAPEVRLLVTARVRLRLDAEWVFDLGGLDVPAGPAEVSASGAGQLFLERARAAQTAAPVGAADYPHIARICRLVDGLPLAIVLAAGRLRNASCAQVAAQLAESLDALEGDGPELPERQRSLGGVLRWSYGQLDDDEARGLQLLAVFPAAFTIEAARAVGGCTPELLEALIDYGLLSRHGEHAYGLHPLVRQVAAAELARAPERRAAAELRHATYFTQVAAGLVAQLARDTTALSPLIACWSDLHRAWDWAVARRCRERLTALRPAMRQLWYALSAFREGVAQCERAVAALASPDGGQGPGPCDEREVVELLLAAAWLHVHHGGGAAQARATMERARALAPRGDDQLAARIDQIQGNHLYLQTRYRAARPLLERALAAATGRDDHDAVLELLSLLARLAFRQCDGDLMRAVLATAGRRFDEQDQSLNLVLLRLAAANQSVAEGSLAPARALLDRVPDPGDAPAHYQIRFWRLALETLIAQSEGRLGEAEALLRRFAREAEQRGSRYVGLHVTAVLGDVLAAQGAVTEAGAFYARTLRHATHLDVPRHHCAALLGQARCAELRGEGARAQQLAEAALRIAAAEGYARLERQGRALLGRVLVQRGAFDEAEAMLALAQAADEAIGHRVLAAEAAVARAWVAQRRGRPQAAVAAIEPLLALLLTSDLVGADDAVWTLGTAARALAGARDPRSTPVWLRGAALLARRAALAAPERRATFLQLTPVHRALHAGAPVAPPGDGQG
jgi:DNA-binding SARP family transcriptional activator